MSPPSWLSGKEGTYHLDLFFRGVRLDDKVSIARAIADRLKFGNLTFTNGPEKPSAKSWGRRIRIE